MKINIRYAFMTALATVATASCSEGQYWTEPADKGQVVAFAKPAATVTVGADDMAPESYTVTIYRSQVTGEMEVPVKLETSDESVISGPSSVTFKAGENTTDYVISIGDIMPGVTYTTTLGVVNADSIPTHVNTQNLSFRFTLSQNLTWAAAGEAAVISTGWVGNEEPINVKVEEGNWPVEGERLFRLVDLYYTLEPDAAEPGHELRFYTDDAGGTLRMANAWTYIGEIYDDEYCFFGCPAQFGGQFISEGSEYLMQGVIGTAASLTGSVSPGWYENLYFVWDCPAK